MKNEIQTFLWNWLIIFEKNIIMLSEQEQIRREKLNKKFIKNLNFKVLNREEETLESWI